MAYVKLPLQPGVFPDDTPLAAEGLSVESNLVRFVRSKPQTRGGWELASTDTFNGICRGLFTWRDNNAAQYCAIGTNTELDVYLDGEIYEITPIVARGQLTNPFRTSLASAVIDVTFSAYSLSSDQRISFPGQSTFNGATISAVGGYEASEITATSFQFSADSVATSSGSGGGAVNYDIFLAPGLEDGIAGAGYGTGAYGIGGYGDDNSGTYFVRTWSFGNWGQNLISNPRGGEIYEWAPNFTATELVTNGNFSSATGWTIGSGWTISSGSAQATLGSASDLSTQVTLAPNAYFLLEFDLARTNGQLSVKVGATTISTSLSATAHYEDTLYTESGTTLSFSKNSSFQGSLDNVTLTQLTAAEVIPNAPTENTCILVTPEQILMTFGTIDIDSGLFDPLGIRWSDTGRGDLRANQTWAPSPSNLSGGTHLAVGGRIVRGMNGRNAVLVWTDTAMYAGRYVPDTNVVYDFVIQGEGCGLIAPNAVCVLAGVAYWMAPSGEFFAYAGGAPTAMQSPLRRDIFDHLSKVQQDKIYAHQDSGWSEAEWLYPDSRDDEGLECSRYGMVNVNGQWANGMFDRTAWVDSGTFSYPLATSTEGALYFQEKGATADGMPLEWSRKTGVIPIGDGNTLWGIRRFFPNVDDWQGGFDLTVYTSNFPNGPWTTYGPYSVPTNATSIDLGPQFPVGKFAQFLLEGNASPAFAREGVHMIDPYDTGMVF